MTSKFFEVFNCLQTTQLTELEFYCDFPKNKLSNLQKKLLKCLIADKKNKQLHTEHSFKRKYWKNKNIAEWNKNKTAFQKVIDRYLLSDLRFKDFWGDFVLLDFYRENYLEKNFNLLWTKLEKKAKAKLSKRSKEKIELYLLYELKTSKDKFNRSPKAVNYLLYSEENLDKFYGLQKLRMACEYLNRKKINAICYHTKADEDIIESIYNKLNDTMEINIYYNIYHLLNSPEKEIFYEEAKKMILQNCKNLPKDILIETLDLLMNYCIRNHTKSKYFFDYKIFFEYMEQEDILLQHNKISIHKYNNYIAISLIQNDFEKVESVIKKYSDRILPIEYAKEAKIIAKLRLYLFQLEVNICWSLIKKIHPNDSTHNFSVEKIYLQLFFLEDKQAFDTKLKSIRRKLDKEKILSKKNRMELRNFMNTLKLIRENKPISLSDLSLKLSSLDYAWIKIVINSKNIAVLQ